MKRKMIVILIGAAVLLLAAAAAVYFFFFRAAGEQAEKPAVQYEYAVESSFVTNVKDSQKLFKTTIVLVSEEKDLEEYFTEHQYVIRDVLLFQLRELTEEDIKSADIKDRLRDTLAAAINEALGEARVKSVYFTDFVMQ